MERQQRNPRAQKQNPAPDFWNRVFQKTRTVAFQKSRTPSPQSVPENGYICSNMGVPEIWSISSITTPMQITRSRTAPRAGASVAQNFPSASQVQTAEKKTQIISLRSPEQR